MSNSEFRHFDVFFFFPFQFSWFLFIIVNILTSSPCFSSSSYRLLLFLFPPSSILSSFSPRPLLPLSTSSFPHPLLTTSSSPRPFHSSSCYILFSIIEMRQALRTQLEQMGSKLPWNHITDQIGMFCFTGISTPQVGTSSFIFLPWSYRNHYLNIRCDKFCFSRFVCLFLALRMHRLPSSLSSSHFILPFFLCPTSPFSPCIYILFPFFPTGAEDARIRNLLYGWRQNFYRWAEQQ